MAVTVFARHSHSYFYYDEWTLLDHVTFHSNNLAAAFQSFNGRLQAPSYVIYWIQVRAFGAGDNTFVFLVFCGSLVALHVTLARLLRAFGLPNLIALLGAAVVVYFGPGSQNMVFELLLAANFALALSFAAGWVVMRRDATPWAAVAVGAALILANAFNNAAADLGFVFVAILIIFRWRNRLGAAAIAVPVLVSAGWALRTGGGSEAGVAAGLHQQWNFAVRLLLLGAGGLAGNGNDILRHHPAAQPVGAALLVVVGVILIVAALRHRISGPSWVALAAGSGGALAAIATTAHARAGTVDGYTLTHFNRYLAYVAIFLLVALLPPLYQGLRPAGRAGQQAVTGTLALALIAIFVANRAPLLDYRRLFETETKQTKTLVAQTVAVLDRGCPPGQLPNPNATPLPDQGPSWRVGLIDALRVRHQLSVTTPRVVPRSIEVAICSKAVATR